MTGSKLSFGFSGDTDTTLKSWVPKLRNMVERLIKVEEDHYTIGGEERTNKFIDGQRVYRKVLELGAMPNNTTKTVTHGIGDYGRILISGWMTNYSTAWAPLPYATPVASGSVAVFADSSDIRIITATDYSGYDGWAILEYTRP